MYSTRWPALERIPDSPFLIPIMQFNHSGEQGKKKKEKRKKHAIPQLIDSPRSINVAGIDAIRSRFLNDGSTGGLSKTSQRSISWLVLVVLV